MASCAACGAGTEIGAASCAACGAPVGGAPEGLDFGIVCPACQQYNEPGFQFCQGCGGSLTPAGFTGFFQAAGADLASAPTDPAEEAATPRPGAEGATTDPAAEGATTDPAAPAPVPLTRRRDEPPAPAPTPTPPAPMAAPEDVAPPAPPPAAAATPAPEEAATATCASCGAENPAGARFCGQCGTAIGGAPGPSRTQMMPVAAPTPATGTRIFGSLAPGRAKLVLVRGRGYEGAEFRLNAESVAAGRAKGLILFPDDPYLADHHATFSYQDGVLYVRDEKGPGGIWLRVRGTVPLPVGAEVAVGDSRLAYTGPLPPAGTPEGPRPLGAPRLADAVRIEERLSDDRPGRAWVLAGPRITVGRRGCQIALAEDPAVEDVHCELNRTDGRLTLTDLESGDGTFMRLAPGARAPLRHDDRIRVGSEVLRVVVAS